MKCIFRKTLNLSSFKNQQGFTLLEMLVTILIFSLVVAGIYAILMAGEDAWHSNKTQVQLQQELRKVMDSIQYDLYQSGSGAIADVPADGAWYNTITFKVPSSLASARITWNANAINYALGGMDSNELQRVSGATTEIKAHYIESLTFRRLSSVSNIVEVALVAQKDTPKGQTLSYSLNFKVKLRN